MDNIQFRTGVQLWGSDYRDYHAFGKCTVSPEAIVMQAGDREHVHARKEIAELRWWDWWLGATLVVISGEKGRATRSRIAVYRKRRLRRALESAGYTFSRETTGFSWPDIVDTGINTPDVSRYRLMRPSGRWSGDD